MPRLPVLALLAAVLARPVAAQDSVHVVIAATTDAHGAATAWDYVHDRAAPGGLTGVATVVDSLRAAYPGAVVLLDNGDLIQGNLFAAYFATIRPRLVHPIVDAMNAMGYDAATPGNHEFSFGLEVLARAYGGAAFPIVSANIYRLPRDTLAFARYVLLPRRGVRVGVTGFTTPGAMVWDREQVGDRILVRPISPQAPDAFRAMRAAGADLVVALAHCGMEGESSYDTTGVGPEDVAAGLADLPAPPDLVIVGHTHGRMRDSVINGVHFVQPQAWARSVAVVHVWMVRTGGEGQRGRYRVTGIRADEVVLADVPPEPVLTQRLRDVHEEVRVWAGEPLATIDDDWSTREARVRDTPIMDFVNAVQRRVTGAQLSATAAFTTDAHFGPGVVRLRDVAGLYPYENTLRAVRIDGERLRLYLERSARYFRTYAPGEPLINDSVPGSDVDMVSGVSFDIDLSQPVGTRIRNLTYRGQPVTAADTFTLALSSARQAGGGGFDMLAGLPVVYDHGQRVRDLLVEAVRAAGTLRADDVFEPSWRLVPDSARAAAIAIFSPPVAARDTVLLRVLATNDLHGALEPSTPAWAGGRTVGGAAATKARMDSLAAECACATVRLDGGDTFQGTPISNLFYGRSVVEAYNAMGYDAAAVGNHEFDWTIDTLRARVAQSRFPWLGANTADRATGERPAWLRDWTMIERDGRRIAVIGLITPSTPAVTSPPSIAGLAFADPAAAVRAVLPAVRAAGADLVVVLAHLGAVCDTECRGESIDLARSLDSGSVDVVLGGHTPGPATAVVHGIPIAQTRHNGGEIAVVDIVRRADGRREARVRLDTVWVDAVRGDTLVSRIVARYAAEVERVTTRVVAQLRLATPRADSGESALGRLIADGFRNAGRTDVAVMNDGGIRADLPAGAVTYGQVFRVLPFRNRLVRVTVPGETLIALLEHTLAGPSSRAHVSGITVRYDPRRPAGRRVREVRLLDGRRVDRKRSYTLTVPDFLASGGGGYTMLAGRPAAPVGVTDLEAVVRYLELLPQPVEPPTTPRLVATR